MRYRLDMQNAFQLNQINRANTIPDDRKIAEVSQSLTNDPGLGNFAG
jgi:hypothetical protein